MTRVTSYGTPHYFLPHHGVYREHSSTTKLRVVFDASAATSSGVSLNDIQQVGPPLQRDLVDILLRFRQHRYTACADVEKMYRQCLLNELQRDLQLIVWRDNPSEPLGIYRLNTVTYGTASAPFLSVRCLKQLALECKDSAVQQIILNDFYVDDMITGSDDKQELLVLCKKVTDVLSSGGFHLRKWIFNFKCDELLVHQIPNNNASQELTLGENVQCKTLGLGWYYASDEFYFNTQVKVDTYKISKRTILSHVSQIFDPLGLLSPTIIIAKVLLQKLWLLQLGWDDEVPRDVLRAWTVFVKGLSMLNTIRIPRHVIANEAICTELHIFTDASQTAYGACIYVRTVTNNGLVSVKLLCSKGKVAPLKPVSIPRLELCGALLGARLYDKDLSPLSPGHFLVGRPLTAPASDDFTETPVHRLTRYQRVEQIRQQFWSRWAKEYVSELQIRTKGRKNTLELQPDMLVVIKDDNLPPLKWHLGRIVKIFPGKDGITRVADIRTSSGVVRRAYSKICPLLDD
ncbi:uncharacterized protein LOC128201625 [Galleria mellonella]|uniref:Uncharacterized protein LOC128201625 n=1 Tax=Galleria mellonella TaxID=7137 RepID=A0ABM3MUW3_GALME|nr:uncharacterized protein LOC128201625 [Galleria mellonella]